MSGSKISEKEDLTSMDDRDIIRKYPEEYALGVAEAFHSFGMTYDDDPESPRSRAYDLGRNEGEKEDLT